MISNSLIIGSSLLKWNHIVVKDTRIVSCSALRQSGALADTSGSNETYFHFCVHTVTHNGIGEVILLALRKASNSSATALTLNVEIVLTSNYSIDEPSETRYSKDPRMILKGNNKRGIRNFCWF